jgi:acetylornithine deacetylase/succinyl-diaminopimelate desuccinylase-like protein
MLISFLEEMVMYSLLRGKAEALQDSVTEFAQRLVQTKSGSLAEENLAPVIEAEMKALGYDRVMIDTAGNVVGLILGREAAPTVLLNCHMDTLLAGCFFPKNPQLSLT